MGAGVVTGHIWIGRHVAAADWLAVVSVVKDMVSGGVSAG